jgi:Na+-driven multidrug efflux pump
VLTTIVLLALIVGATADGKIAEMCRLYLGILAFGVLIALLYRWFGGYSGDQRS